MSDLRVDADPDVWVGVPSHWGEDTYPDHAAWARATADSVWTDSRPTPGQGPDGLALVLAMLVERLPLQADWRQTWLWLPEPDEQVLPVLLAAYQAEGSTDDAFADLARPDAPFVEPPVVEAFDFPHLGPGRSLLRYASGDGDDLLLARHLHVRSGGLDVHLHVSTHDLALGARAMGDIEALARSARLVEP